MPLHDDPGKKETPLLRFMAVKVFFAVFSCKKMLSVFIRIQRVFSGKRLMAANKITWQIFLSDLQHMLPDFSAIWQRNLSDYPD